MVFSYYNRLTVKEKQIYRQSDKITSIPLPQGEVLSQIVEALGAALKSEDREKTEELSQKLVNTIADQLKIPRVRVNVLQVRPSNRGGELHGLYNPRDGKQSPNVKLWMRTVKRRQVVAFRTFLRTLLHELCHHLDYELFKLRDSFHTEGFYKRESSLAHQLLIKDNTIHPVAQEVSSLANKGSS